MTREHTMRTMARTLRLGGLALAIAGCGLLDTTTPNIIDPGNLNTPEGAEALRLGALSDFMYARDGDGDLNVEATDGQIMTSGLMADEFVLSTTPPTQQEIDQRAILPSTNGTLSDYYFFLHKARRSTEVAAERLQRFALDPDGNQGIPEMLALSGLTYVYFGEGFCSGVPYSRLDDDGKLIFGSSRTNAESFQLAIERFDSAAQHPSVADSSNEIFFLAQVGKARALQDLGLFAEAAVVAASVPDGFSYVMEHAAVPLQLNNAIFQLTNNNLFSVSNKEGGNGLPYRSALDPRVPFVSDGRGLDGSTRQFNLLKYPDAAADVVVGDWIEARLIQAEALVSPVGPGDRDGMTTILNELRADSTSLGLGNLAVPGTLPQARSLLFRERAFWLFATGHRHSDMRRLARQYSQDPETIFPAGPYVKGGSYGTDVNLPIPFDEYVNPNLNLGLCDTKAP